MYEAKWWAGLYGSPTWKRHIGWSNCRTVQCLDSGVLTAAHKKIIAKKGVKSTRQYVNKTGKKGFCGSKLLKSTGKLGFFVGKPLLVVFTKKRAQEAFGHPIVSAEGFSGNFFGKGFGFYTPKGKHMYGNPKGFVGNFES